MKYVTVARRALHSAIRGDPAMTREQFRLIFAQIPDSTRMSLLVAWILAIVVWPHPPIAPLAVWILTLTGVLAIRYISARRYLTMNGTPDGGWMLILLGGTAATGLLLGVSGAFLRYTPPMLDIVVIATITIMSVSAISFLAHYLPAYLVYLFTSTVPMMVFVSASLDPFSYITTILYLTFMVAMCATSWRFNRVITERLQLQREADRLSARLSAKNKELLAELGHRHTVESELKRNKQYIDAIFANAPVEMYLKDREGRYLKVNRQFEKIFGVRDQEVRGKLPQDIHEDELARRTLAQDREVLESGRMHVVEEHCRLPGLDDEEEHSLLTIKFPVKTEDDEIIGLGAVVFDISRQKKAERELMQSRERFRDFAEIASDYYWEVDADMNLTFASSRGHILNGVPMAELVSSREGKLTGGRITVDDEWRSHLERRDARQPYEVEVTFVRGGDKESRIQIKANPIFDDHRRFAGFRGVARDITREYRLHKDFLHQATHDPLTGLFNRRKFLQCVDDFLEDSREFSRSHLFCYVDLDRFKFVNDSSGHIAGDALLVEVSNVIRTHLRSEDVLGRIGGDEFGILLKNCSTSRGSSIGNQIIRALQDLEFHWIGRRYTISASIGISVIDGTAGSATTVLSDADQACYRAKELGAGRVFVSNRTGSGLSRHAQSYRYTDWLDAFDKSQIQLYAQPIVSLSEDAGESPWYEILIRLVDRRGNEHPPEYFLPYAERFGQIARVDQWVVEQTFEQIQMVREWRNSCFSINLSGASLHSDRLRSDILARFAHGEVRPENICFEITETSAIKNLGLARNFIERLRAEGCRLAIDDFGTGLASFSYLKHFPVDCVKIDGSFIQDLKSDPYNPIFVESICQVAGAMHIETVAECVESEEFLDRLRGIGVDYAQGLAIGKPRPLGDI